MAWNYDMSQAPRGETKTVTRTIGKNTVEITEHLPAKIIAGGACGVVTVSYWVMAAERWAMFTKEVPPIAWQPWPEPAVVVGDGK